MTHVITELVERLALPPDGIDLRAELVALQSARIRQALAKAGGDYARAARLLRMSRVELRRLEAKLASDGGDAVEPAELTRIIPRISAGVELISATIIRRYHAEGLDEKTIASRIGCNVYVVEKVLRMQTEAEIVRLDRVEKLAPNAIADRLRVPRSRVRRVLKHADAAASKRPE